MDKNERRVNLKKFRDGKIDLLVSTDLVARGIDIESVDQVINYHLPKQMQNYLHRAGRTARAGRPGTVINLVTERDLQLVSQLDGNQPVFTKRAASPTSNTKRLPPKTKRGPQRPSKAKRR